MKSVSKRALAMLGAFVLALGCLAIPLPEANSIAVAEEPLLPYMDTSLTFEERAADLVSRMTLEEKISLLGNNTNGVPRLGVSKYDFWSEGLHGVGRSGEATSFSKPLVMASTWDPDMIREMATVISDEARAYNNEKGKGLSYWSPTINMARDPRWGRNYETFGEDPYLTSMIGGNFVEGMQGDDDRYIKVIATLKHYAANNSEYNRHTGTSDVEDDILRDYYTRAFENIVRWNKVESVMSSYNRVNGVPSAANKYLLNTLLRQTFGFDGYVTSDCGGIEDVYKQHKWVPEELGRPVTPEETVYYTLAAGNDIECGGFTRTHAMSAVETGILSEDQIDLNLVRTFTARMRTGEFDPAEMVPYRSEEYSWENQIEAEDHKALAETTTDDAVVLLKNDNDTLPLDITTQKNIVMIGAIANQNILGDYAGMPSAENLSTPIQGMQALGANVTFIEGKAPQSTSGNYICNMKNIILTYANGTKLTLKATDAKQLNGCKLEEGKDNIGYIMPGATLMYENVNIENLTQVTFQLAGDGSIIDGTVTMTMDSSSGMPVASVKNEKTGGWQNYKDITSDVSDLGGATTKDLYVSFEQYVEDIEFSATEAQQIKDADAVIVCVDGNKSGEGSDRATIAMPAFQTSLINGAAKINPNTIVYLQSVGVMELGSFIDNVPAMLWTCYNGQAQGNAMARVIYGVTNPTAKLPITWYEKNSALESIDQYDITNDNESTGWSYQYYTGPVTYPFGYGLSYTTYEYSNLQVQGAGSYQPGDVDGKDGVTASDALMALQAATKKITLSGSETLRADVDGTDGVAANDALMILQMATKKITMDAVVGSSTFTPDDTMTVTVDVKNTGKVDGREVVQLYVANPENDGVKRPFKQLKAFDKVAIKAGETETVTLTLDLAECHFWDNELQKNVWDEGEYTLFVGPSSDEDLALSTTFEMNGQITPELEVATLQADRVVLNAADTSKVMTTTLTASLNNNAFLDLKDADITYTSKNDKVATVDENGVVRAVGGGVTSIEASVTYNGKTMTSSVPVVVRVELAGVCIDGVEYDAFKASTTEYHVPVISEKPVLSVPNVPAEYVSIQNPTSVPGTGSVTITIGDTAATYTFNFVKRSTDYVVARFSAIEQTYTATNRSLYTDWKTVDGGKAIDFTSHDLDDLHLRFRLDLKQVQGSAADSQAYKSGQIKLRSVNDPGENNYGWYVGNFSFKTGVNYVDVPLSMSPNSTTGNGTDWICVDRMNFYIDSLTNLGMTVEGTLSDVMVVDVSLDPAREALWELVNDGVNEEMYTPSTAAAYRKAKEDLQALIFQSTPVGEEAINVVKNAYLDAKSKLVEDTYLIGTFTKNEGNFTVLNNGTGTTMYNNWQNGDTEPYDLSGDRSNLRLQLTVKFNSKVATVANKDIWSKFTIKLRSSDRDDPNDPNNREHNYGWDFTPSSYEDTETLQLSIDLSSTQTNKRGSIDWADVERLIMMADLSNNARNDAATNDNFYMTVSGIRIVDLTNVLAEKEEIQALLDTTVTTAGKDAALVTAYEKAVTAAQAVCATELATSKEVYEAHVALADAIDALK